MASVVAHQHEYDIVTGNDADADRHGIVTPDGGLMNPNHYLAVAIQYLYTHRPLWRTDAAVGKTLVVEHHDRRVADPRSAAGCGKSPSDSSGSCRAHRRNRRVRRRGERGRELPAARRNGLDDRQRRHPARLLASEILAVTGKTPSQLYDELTARFGDPVYERVDAPASNEQKARLGKARRRSHRPQRPSPATRSRRGSARPGQRRRGRRGEGRDGERHGLPRVRAARRTSTRSTRSHSRGRST